MEASTSFAARRPAATALPAFTLPPPDLPSMQRDPASASLPLVTSRGAAYNSHPLLSPAAAAQTLPPVPSVASVLTPPSGVSTDGLSPLSSGVNSGSSQSSQPSAGGAVYYPHMTGSWSAPANPNSYSYSASAGQHHGSLVQPFSGRSIYSPSMQYGGRSSASPATGDGLPPPYHQDLPPFPTPISGGGSGSSNLPSQSSQAQLQSAVLNSQNSVSQPPTPASAPPSADPYRAPPTPGYYPPGSTPQQPSFPSYAPHQPSPTQPSPTTSAASRTLSSIAGQPGTLSAMAPPPGYMAGRPPAQAYSYHQLPAGSVMSNIGNPGGNMAIVGGVGGMGLPGYGGPHHPGAMSHMYAQHQPPQPDRPFKCDQCPQSFNRNHDLKRHKRIHLAVKPFPCTFCDKSFSRKDALKRHRLVKGCGEKQSNNDGANANGTAINGSPPDRSEIMSDGTDESPKLGGKKE